MQVAEHLDADRLVQAAGPDRVEASRRDQALRGDSGCIVVGRVEQDGTVR